MIIDNLKYIFLFYFFKNIYLIDIIDKKSVIYNNNFTIIENNLNYQIIIELNYNCNKQINYKFYNYYKTDFLISENNFTKDDIYTAYNYLKNHTCILDLFINPIIKDDKMITDEILKESNQENIIDEYDIIDDVNDNFNYDDDIIIFDEFKDNNTNPNRNDDDLLTFIKLKDSNKLYYYRIPNNEIKNISQITPSYIKSDIMNIEKFYKYTNYSGENMTIHYIDGGYYDHEDMNNIIKTSKFQCSNNIICNHGVWSLGIMAANDNNFGIRGIAPNANYVIYTLNNLLQVLKNAHVGDIVGASITYVENNIQIPLFCKTYFWKMIKKLLDKNIPVLLSAGNSNYDLSLINCPLQDKRTIISTACDKLSGKKLKFSNYNYNGFMFCNWGNNVLTTGSSKINNMNNGNISYNHNYSGTSSSNPLNVGLFALLQGYIKYKYNSILTIESLIKIFDKTSKKISKKNVGKHIDLFEAYKYLNNNFNKSIFIY